MRAVKTPTVLQMEAVECGAAALGMVLASYGRWEALEDLRVACGVSRDGSSAANIVRAARSYGFEAKGWRKETESLRQIAVPAILHWDFSHFVVLEGFAGKRVRINDPARGRRTIDFEELDRCFTGVVLTMKPGEDFATGGKPDGSFAALVSRLRRSGGALAFAILAGLAVTVPGIALAVLVKIFVDDVLVSGRNAWAAAVIGGVAAVALAQFVLYWLQGRALARFSTMLAVTSTAAFLWHIVRLPMVFFMQRSAGDLAQRVSANSRLADLVANQGTLAAVNVVSAVVFLGVMFTQDVLLSLMAVVFAALNVSITRLVYEQNSTTNQQLLSEAGKLQGVAVAGLFNIETLKAGGREADFFARWAGQHARVLNAGRESAARMLLINNLPALVTALSTAAILVVGGFQIMDETLTFGQLFAFQSLMLSFTAPVQGFVQLTTQLQLTEGYMKRIDDVSNYAADPSVQVGAGKGAAGPELLGALELRDVTFGYSPLAAPLVRGISLHLAPGARVAIVGGSGSGKSTIAKLVCGLYQPWEGEILFDGRPRSDIGGAVLADAVGFVDQDLFLFEGTVRENLTLWDTTVPESRLVAAAQDACIHDDIARRPDAYDARVDENGRNFSGGQRQRLEIARALVNNPAILVLDEATSALDPVTEQRFDAALRRRGTTCLIVAHRLSTVRDCDEIIVLDKGSVVERGTHEELMRIGGTYASLIGQES